MKLSKQPDKVTKPKKKKRNVEHFSEKDILELMDVNRQTYVRGRGGAIKRK